MWNKTKAAAGVQLPASSFAYVGDPEDTSTWKLPIHFPGDVEKSLNCLKSALVRFDSVAIPEAERESVWHFLRGAAAAHGVAVERRAFASEAPGASLTIEAQATPSTKVEEESNEDRPILSETELSELTALADLRAELFLKSLGLE